MIETLVESLLSEALQVGYHVTFLKNLPLIKQKGLVPQGSGRFNFGSQTANSKGKVFLTTWEGVERWIHQLYYVGFDKSDNMVEDGYIPVVLRSHTFRQTEPDEPGTQDSGGNQAVGVRPLPKDKASITPEELEYWNPFSKDWEPVSTMSPSALFNKTKAAAVRVQDDDVEYLELPGMEGEFFTPSHR